jgi:hypothetical protein
MKVRICLAVVLATLVAATWAWGDGFNLTSWPLIVHSTAIQDVFADSMTTGCQLTGGYPSAVSDEVSYYDAFTGGSFIAWYKVGGPGPQNVWQGNLTTIEPDKSYWITIRGAHAAVTLTMTGAVSDTNRIIPIAPGDHLGAGTSSFNYVGSCFAVPCSLKNAGLVASGFTGGYPSGVSDYVQYIDQAGNSFLAWYKVGGPGPQNVWQGNFSTLEPGQGYWIEVRTAHAFASNQWIYPVPAKGAKAVLSKEIRVSTESAAKGESFNRLHRSLSPSVNKSLAPEKTVEGKRTR